MTRASLPTRPIQLLLIGSIFSVAGCNEVGVTLPQRKVGEIKPVVNPSDRCSAIRQQLLAITPPGTRAQEVLAFVAAEMQAHRKTRQSLVAEATKLRNGPALIPRPSCETRGWHYRQIGSKHIMATFEDPSVSFMLGIPVSTKNVAQVWYAFDGDARVLDIGVSTFTSGLP
jgi:hypothetical protein